MEVKGKFMNIDEIFNSKINLRKKIDTFLNRDIYKILRDNTYIEEDGNECFVIEHYGPKLKVEFSRSEFLLFILNKIEADDAICVSNDIDVEELFKLFISKKIITMVLS